MMKKPELLAPAGNMEKLKMALIYGADAVYLGGKAFGLRAYSNNFNEEEMAEAFAFAHQLNKKVYITVNIFAHNTDLETLPQYLEYLYNQGADGIIVSDLGVYRIARQVVPDLPIHVSTQANNTNWASALMWQELGVKRIVLARELSLREITEIHSKTSLELEAFIHGAMCISYSGRCLLSNYFAGRDANRGECVQACRWKYYLVEETRPGQFWPVVEDDKGTYIFNSKDLCMLPYIPQLIQAGLSSLKIEGRMKSVHYVASVVNIYRQAIDRYFNDPEHYAVDEYWLEELEKISHRAYTSGFYFNKATEHDQIYTTTSYMQTHEFIGLVKSYNADNGTAIVEQRNNMKVGQEIEIVQPGVQAFTQFITAMKDEDGNEIEVAPHPQQIISIPVIKPVTEYAMLRRRVEAI